MPKKISEPEEGRQASEEVRSELHEELLWQGITPESLSKQLKDELEAKETKLVKVKRNENPERVMREIMEDMGMKSVLTPGVTKIHETTEEVVIAIDMINWGIRQKARMDAHKLRGDYPAEKREITGGDGGPIMVNIIDRFPLEGEKRRKSVKRKVSTKRKKSGRGSRKG